ncbi:tetratricopeptide repeat protein [Bacteroides salyersiae]|uniref:tetratricopeptide repeat protein n=1 Tax=Bacteroides salyersiae TaxID=291644 RepID=UPI001C8CAD95|nr:tetratricopeptide repeat protein [Bacteroides salyersiae]
MRKFILLVAMCCATGSIFAQTDPNQLKKEGNDALNAKNYQVAFTKYDAYLKQTNNSDSVMAYNCGVCADQIKKYADAVKYFDVAIQKNYNVANAYARKAGALKDLKKDAEMVETLEAGLKIAPDNKTMEKLYAIHYLKEGQKFQKANDIAKAEESYKQVTTLSGKKWKTDALYSLGVLFYNNGATVLKKAAPLANSDADKYATEKAAADADFKKAADYLQEATTLSPERAEIKKMLTQVQESLN